MFDAVVDGQVLRVAKPQVEIQSFPTYRLEPTPPMPPGVVAPQALKLIQTRSPDGPDLSPHRHRRPSVVLGMPPTQAIRPRRNSVTLSGSEGRVHVVEISAAGSPDGLKSKSPCLTMNRAIENSSAALGTTMSQVASIPAAPHPQLADSCGIAVPLNSVKSANPTAQYAAQPSHSDPSEGCNKALDLEGLNLPKKDTQIKSWLSSLQRKWRGARTVSNTRAHRVQEQVPDQISEPSQPLVAVARQLGLINRTRKSRDWPGGENRPRGDIWSTRKRAKIPDNEALKRHVQHVEWNEHVRARTHAPPSGGPRFEAQLIKETHREHLISQYGAAHNEQDGFVERSLDRLNQETGQLIQGVHNAVDAIELLYKQLTSNGARTSCTTTDDLKLGELIARVGLLAQVNLDPAPLDQVETHTFNSTILNELSQDPCSLPAEAVRTLTNWYNEHQLDPYPTQRETATLAQQCAITPLQVTLWLKTKQKRAQLCHKRRDSMYEAQLDLSDHTDEDQDEVVGVVEMAPWKGFPGLILSSSDGWQVLTIPREDNKKPTQHYFSPCGQRFTTIAAVKKFLSDSGTEPEANTNTGNQSRQDLGLGDVALDRVCAECKPKHRTVDMCRVLHGHTAPNWNAHQAKSTKTKRKRRPQT